MQTIKTLTHLYTIGTRRTFRARELIYQEGETGTTMHWIVAGTVLIKKDGLEIAQAGRGEFIGEMSLIDQSPRFATVVAESECETIEVDRDQFLELVRAEPEFALAIMSNLSRKLRESDSSRVDELEENNLQLTAKNDQLNRTNAFLERIIEQSPAGIVILDDNGTSARMNPSARRILRLSDDHRPWSVGEHCIGNCPLRRLIDEERESWTGECRFQIDGAQKTFYVSISHLDTTAETPLYLMIFEDISELIELNDQIIKLERLATEGELAAEIAHHINNYLAVLSGNLELVQARLKSSSDADLSRWLNGMNQGLDEIARFVDGLMGTREQAGELQARNIDEMVRVILKFLGPQKRFRQIQLSARTAEDFPLQVRVNESLLHQVLLNLLINAADALGSVDRAERRITVELCRAESDSAVLIKVSDNGPGMDPKHQADLFSRRFTTKPTGHGIGLITVKKIIDFHGGTISCHSTLGVGTTFTIALPV